MSISISGNGSFTGANSDYSFDQSVGIAGTLSYEDVTNIDSVGIITARDGLDTPTNLVLRTGGTEQVRIDSSGNVGIGESSPNGTLHVKGSSPKIILEGTNGGGTYEHYLGTAGSVAQDFIIQAGSDTTLIRSDNLLFQNTAASTEYMRIDSSGRLGLGTSSPKRLFHLNGGSETVKLQITNTTTGSGNDGDGFQIGIAADGTAGIEQRENADLTFATNNTERMRITSSGLFGFNHTSPQFGITIAQSANDIGKIGWEDAGSNKRASITCSTSTDALQFHVGTSDTERMRIRSNGQSFYFSDSSFVFRTIRTGASNALLSCQNNASDIDSGTQVMRILADGDLENANNNYGALSDVKLKENIVDAESQWEDLKGINIRNYNFKEELGFGTNTYIGVVAQELELVSPNLVKTIPDRDNDDNDLGTTTKSVKYSVLYMKAVKALQEAMERIETLEAEVQALKGS